MQITATELKLNLGRYLNLASSEDVIITKNGMDIAVISAPKKKTSIVDELIGVIPNDGMDIKEHREERIRRYENNY